MLWTACLPHLYSVAGREQHFLATQDVTAGQAGTLFLPLYGACRRFHLYFL